MAVDPPKAKQIFLTALEIESSEARSAYLSGACGDDHGLRKEVDDLIRAHDFTADFLDNPVGDIHDVARGEPVEKIGSTIGPYKLLQQIGEGGMGTVYMAEQTHPIKRRVAVKVVKPGMDTREVLARFEAERQALALMDHPSIAKVFDCGSTDSGRPYFVMELVKGLPITEYCDEHNLTPQKRLQLFAQVCQAIQHAHQKGIIHRDLKPSNILVAEYDDQAVPKVIDFGIAKALSQELTEKTLFTQYGQILGTIEYMSPEQAKVNQLDVDTRSDIFSLGVVLYELLAGTTQFDKQRLRSAAWDEMLRIIREEDPPRPSWRLSTLESAPSIAAHRHTEPKKLSALLRNELDWIVMKSMEKDRARRYETANGLARDIQRFLDGEAVEAHPPSLGYLASRFVKKHVKPLLVGSSIAIVLTLMVTGILWISNERQKTTEADGLVRSLATSDTEHVSTIVDELQKHSGRTKDDLDDLFETSEDGSNAKLHAGMALLGHDDSKLSFLKDQLLEVRSEQFKYVRDHLESRRNELISDLWRQARKLEQDAERSFRAACALATYDSSNEQWGDGELARFVADQLVFLSPSEVGMWQAVLRPVGKHLTKPLAAIYRDQDRSQSNRVFAAGAVADFSKDNADALFDLMVDGDPGSFRILFDVLTEHHRQRAIQLGHEELEKNVTNIADAKAKMRLPERQANAGIMLLRLGDGENLSRKSLRSEVRTYLVHRFRPSGGVIENLDSVIFSDDTADEAMIRAALLCLGEFDDSEMPENHKRVLVDRLFEIYKSKQDPGIHGACAWLLKQWNEVPRIQQAMADLKQDEARLKTGEFDELDWYVNTQGQTFSIVRLTDFQMGSPESEPGHLEQEKLHTRKVDRRIAAATTEVTKAQWRRFFEAEDGIYDLENEPSVILVCHTDDSPIVGMTWFEAAGYCNWLSKVEGIEKEQWCYEPNDQGVYGPGMRANEDFLNKTGYRLPTEAEWEFLCRAGTSTAMSWGETETHGYEYAYFSSGALWKSGKGGLIPVAQLKPNDFGLFDMHGNAYERCFDIAADYPDASVVDAPESGLIAAFKNRIVRGGAYDTYSVRSAGRLNGPPLARTGNGCFRPVRTFSY